MRHWWIPAALACIAVVAVAPGVPAVAGWQVDALTIVSAVLGLVFSAIIVAIAVRAGEWPPALVALGCVSMAFAGAGHLAELLDGQPVRDMLVPYGMVAGGAFFAAGSFPRWPAAPSKRSRARAGLCLAVLALAAAGASLTITGWAVPGWALRGAAGLSAAAYLLAASRMLAVARLVHLPAPLAMGLGSVAFAPITVVVAIGGLPFGPSWLLQLLMLAAAVLPVSGFIVEQRRRPGLRTMVLGLFLPGAVAVAVAAVRRGYPSVLVELVERIGDYDEDLRGHVERVADLALEIAIELQLTPGAARNVVVAAQLHDVGKLFVARSILNKPGRLDEDEWSAVQKHAELGARLVERVPELAVASPAILQHHERWDGSGYPRGLSAEAICVDARIVAVADVFDALRSSRAYKQSWSQSQVVDELLAQSGAQFDPSVVAALCRVLAHRIRGEGRLAAA